MRDFRSEEMNAAHFELPLCVKAPEFSWSLSRRMLFEKCRRAYFIRYYLAQGGWDIYASREAQDAYSSGKNMLPANVRLSAFFIKTLCRALDAVRQYPHSLQLKMFAEALKTLLHCEANSKEFREEEKSSLLSCADALLESRACASMVTAQSPGRFNAAFKKDFMCGEVHVWHDPGAVWREHEYIFALRPSFAEYSHEWLQDAADVFALRASMRRSTAGLAPVLLSPVRSGGGEWKMYSCAGNAGKGRALIKASSDEMLGLEGSDGAVCAESFPPCSGEGCGMCVFAKICALSGQKDA